MPVCKLTDSLVENLECPPGRAHIEYFDSLMRGLYVDVMASGRLSYRVRYRQEKIIDNWGQSNNSPSRKHTE